MIKTIKVKKQLRLDELIKYIFDNKIVDKKFSSDIKLEPYYDNKNSVYVHSNGTVSLGLGQSNEITTEDTFTVEVEEEITKDTIFEGVQEIYIDDEGVLGLVHHPIWDRKSINDVLEERDEETECLYIYAAVDYKTELIWEAE